MPPADLRSVLDLDDLGGGRYAVGLGDDWNIVYVFGGVSMAIAAEAARRAVAGAGAPGELRSATATFIRPVSPGPLELSTRILRRGRFASQVTADLLDAEGEPALHLAATFGQHEETELAYLEARFPDDVDAPDDCPPVDRAVGPLGALRFHEQVEWRPGGPEFVWADDRAPGPARSATWFRFESPQVGAGGTIDPVALCVPGDVLGPAVGRRLGAGAGGRPSFLVLSLTISLDVVGPWTGEWLLQHVRSQHAGEGYAYGTAELWNEDRTLVALASQRARLRVIDGLLPATPPGHPRDASGAAAPRA